MPPDVDRIANLLSRHRFTFGNEIQLQDAIETLLNREGIAHEREFTLGDAGDIDFMCGAIGIEVKVQGSPAAVTEQLLRYARHPDVAALILVTSKNSLANQPARMAGKPLVAVSLWQNGF